jgi:hypothetical protein
MQSFVQGSFDSQLHEERSSLKRSTRQSHSCFQSYLHALDPIFGLASRCSGLESKALFESYCMFIMLMRLCLEEPCRVAGTFSGRVAEAARKPMKAMKARKA